MSFRLFCVVLLHPYLGHRLVNYGQSDPNFALSLNPGDRITIEIDLRDSRPEYRTMHMFFKGIKEEEEHEVDKYAYNIPLFPQFAFDIHTQSDEIIFEEYCTKPKPMHKPIDDRKQDGIAPREE